LRYNHEFDWTNVEILDRETFYWKRIISEMLNIRLQNNELSNGHRISKQHIYIDSKQIIIIIHSDFYIVFYTDPFIVKLFIYILSI